MKVTNMKILPIISLVLVMLFCGTAYGTTRHVPSQYAEIQWGILASSDWDTVMVAPGYYPEEIAFYRIRVVVISSGGAEVTTIDAQTSGVPAVVFQSCLPGAELNGFTVTGSDYTGVLVNYSSPRILNNIIEYNSSSSMNIGGGIDLNYSTSSFIKKNIIRNNIANTYGAAIHTEYSTNDTICYNLMYDNYGFTEIRCLNTTAAIYNNTIDGDGSRWSGISNQLSGTLDCRNNIIVNMVANGIVGAGPGTGYAVASYNDIYNCAGGAFGGPYVTQGPGNIFVAPGFWGMPPGTPEEYDITPFSQCVDAGDPDPFFNDRDGSRNDMGWRDAFYDIPVLYVPGDYPTIQGAINAALNDWTIVVFPGIYNENIDFLGKRIAIYGNDGPEVTTISASDANIATVKISSSEPKGTVLSGFTITGSNITGVYCYGSSPEISNNIIENNSSNYINNGGGIDLNYTTSSVIRDNIIRDNSAQTYGAAIHTEYSTNDTICYNLIYDNYGYTEIRCLNTTAAIYNNTIDGAGSRWSGISNQLSGTLDCRNNIIVNMVANGIVGAGPGAGYAVASYNDIYNCAGGAFGGPYVTQGPGNIFSNPLFWGMPPGTPEEYDIRPFSPCVDSGDPDPFFNDSDGSRNDMGWKPWYLAASKQEIPSLEALPIEIAISQNYPNPFNAQTTIEYNLPEEADVTIEIYDLLGRRIETLIAERQQAGFHQVYWNANNKASGAYFYQLKAGDYVESRKMTLLK